MAVSPPTSKEVDAFNMKFFKTMASIFIPTSAPLAFAVTPIHPLFLGASSLGLFLAYQTVTPQPAPTCGFDKDAEKRALKNLVTTSPSNRITRIAMGSCHVGGACLYSLSSNSNSNSILDHLKQSILILLICSVAGIWLSSGYNGQ